MNLSQIRLILLALSCSLSLSAESSKLPNILFIAVDDLRPELSCYGSEYAISPNIDRLADMGTLFERAYVQVPVCGASRASLMSGMYPTSERFLWYGTRFDKPTVSRHNSNTRCTGAPNVPDIPSWFKQMGYKTHSMGKIYHHTNDNEAAWDVIDRVSYFRAYALPENKSTNPPYESADVSDDAYPTGVMTRKIIGQINEAKASDKPFFLGAGFAKPHLPFVAPSKYWDLYDADAIEFPHNYTFAPENVPSSAGIHERAWGELRSYGGVPKKGPVSDDMAKKLIHGYLACVSYTDAMIGQLIDELERLEMLDDTIIILWGDHGYQLGDHTLWCKHTLLETSMHAPLIVSAPGFAPGQRVSSLAEMVDIYPTLCELAGIELPNHLQGKSLVPVMEDPKQTHKKAIFGRYHGGETVRTDRFQYSEWDNGDRMLYDHKVDPSEDKNVIDDPKYSKVAEAMESVLKKHREKVEFDANTDLDAPSEASAGAQSGNTPPVWNASSFNQKSTKTPFASVGEEYLAYVNWRVSDAEEKLNNQDRRLVFKKVSGPQWLSMAGPKYGKVSGTPAKSDIGINKFILSVSDGVNAPVQATMILEVK